MIDFVPELFHIHVNTGFYILQLQWLTIVFLSVALARRDVKTEGTSNGTGSDVKYWETLYALDVGIAAGPERVLQLC